MPGSTIGALLCFGICFGLSIFRTQRWETPAPWDEQYRSQQPQLELIEKAKVASSSRR